MRYAKKFFPKVFPPSNIQNCIKISNDGQEDTTNPPDEIGDACSCLDPELCDATSFNNKIAVTVRPNGIPSSGDPTFDLTLIRNENNLKAYAGGFYSTDAEVGVYLEYKVYPRDSINHPMEESSLTMVYDGEFHIYRVRCHIKGGVHYKGDMAVELSSPC